MQGEKNTISFPMHYLLNVLDVLMHEFVSWHSIPIYDSDFSLLEVDGENCSHVYSNVSLWCPVLG